MKYSIEVSLKLHPWGGNNSVNEKSHIQKDVKRTPDKAVSHIRYNNNLSKKLQGE